MNAETAKNELTGYNFGGLRINIEWSKRSGRYKPIGGGKGNDRSRSRENDQG
jgi:hypothetical protein